MGRPPSSLSVAVITAFGVIYFVWGLTCLANREVVAALLAGWLLAGEPLTLGVGVASVLIVGAVALTVSARPA